jgi:hypothetical protein
MISAIPFHSNSTNELPVGIIQFLPSADLNQFSCVNRAMHDQIEEEMKIRKKELVDHLIYYFYYSNAYDLERKCITIRKQYNKDYYKNVRILFHCLPELFDFIETHKITHLDLGCTNDYGGHAESPYRIISSNYDEICAAAKQVLHLLSQNTTLITCNLGLFQDIIGRKQIIDAVENHPTLDYLEMLSNGASTRFSAAPTTLYRNRRDRSFYWDRFRHDDLNSEADV